MANNKTMTTEVKVTNKSSKPQLINFLNLAYKQGIKDETLKQSVLYAGGQYHKDPKKVTNKDLFDLASQIMKSGMKVMQTVKAVVKPAPVKPVEASTKTGKKSVPLAKMFPPEITTDEGVHLVAVPNKYKDIDSIRKALNEGKSLVFANYWTKRHLKQFDYVKQYRLSKCKSLKEFPNDLDLAIIEKALEVEDKLIGISAYTDAIVIYYGNELAPVEDEDNSGEKFSIRFSNGMEYEIYEVDEDITEEEPEPEVEEEAVEDVEPEEEEAPVKPAPKKVRRVKSKK